jgi:hypothetical protein
MIKNQIIINCLLIAFFLCVGLSTPSEANYVCVDLFASRSLQTLLRLTPAEMQTLRDIRQRLNERALEEINTRREYARSFIPSDSFTINSQRYLLEGLLGAGNEGLVIHAKRESEDFAVKFFYERVDFEANISELRQLEDSFPVSRIREIDLESLAIVFDYIEGVGLRDLSIMRNEIGPDLWVKIEAAANTLFGDRTLYVYNSVLEIETGRIYLIDPR